MLYSCSIDPYNYGAFVYFNEIFISGFIENF